MAPIEGQMDSSHASLVWTVVRNKDCRRMGEARDIHVRMEEVRDIHVQMGGVRDIHVDGIE